MEEQWKEFHTYRVSNYGRVINRYGRELHPIRNTTRGYQTLYYSLRWGGERHTCRVSALVAKLFLCQNPNCGTRIYATPIDGDYRNNRADNLKIAEWQKHGVSEAQRKVYEECVYGTVRACCAELGLFQMRRNGFDIDNVLGECYLQIWIKMPSFWGETSKGFYAFCRCRCKSVIASEYKKFRERLGNEISVEQLLRIENFGETTVKRRNVTND